MVSAVSVSSPARATNPAPAASPAMPPHRRAAFVNSVASRLRAGAGVPVLVREQQALVTALADAQLEAAIVKAYCDEMAVQNPNPDYHVSAEEAREQIQGILRNRIRDAQQFITLLSDAAFLAEVKTQAAKPSPAPKEYDLPPEKKEEIISELNPGGNQPLVHIAANALGQRIVHMALANIYRPKSGGLADPLAGALARAWPEATGAQLQELAKTWLKARHDPAHSVADGMKPDGELLKEAMKRAREQSVPTKAAPTLTVTAPVATKKTLKDTSELVMEV